MGFLKDVKTEWQQNRAANRIINQKARAAALQERQTQAIRVAREREKIKAERQIKGYRNPQPVFQGFGNLMGSAPSQTNKSNRRKITTYVKKGKKYIKKTSYRKMPNTEKKTNPYALDWNI